MLTVENESGRKRIVKYVSNLMFSPWVIVTLVSESDVT
jgi:hypothetical protein